MLNDGVTQFFINQITENFNSKAYEELLNNHDFLYSYLGEKLNEIISKKI
jgi:hypothetical protein